MIESLPISSPLEHNSFSFQCVHSSLGYELLPSHPTPPPLHANHARLRAPLKELNKFLLQVLCTCYFLFLEHPCLSSQYDWFPPFLVTCHFLCNPPWEITTPIQILCSFILPWDSHVEVFPYNILRCFSLHKHTSFVPLLAYTHHQK